MKTRLLIIMSLGIFGFFTLSFLLFPSIFGEPYCTDGGFNTDCKSWNNWEWIYYNLSGYRDYPPPLNLSEINLQRVLNHCNDTTSDAKTAVCLEYQNSTHYINNTNCEWVEIWDGYPHPYGNNGNIERILNEKDCVELGRWLDTFVHGIFNEYDLIFDLPISNDLKQNVYLTIPYCIDTDNGGFFKLNTKHIIDFDILGLDDSKK